MKKIKKYLLSIALVSPFFFLGAKKSHADQIVINHDIAPGVNVRKSPKMEDSNIIGGIDFADRYEIKGENKYRFEISFEGQKAFVGKQRFFILNDTKVLKDTNLYKENKSSSKSLLKVKKNDRVTVLAFDDSDFVKVEYKKKEGYVNIKDLAISKQKKEDLEKFKEKYFFINDNLERHKNDNLEEVEYEEISVINQVDDQAGEDESDYETITYNYYDVTGDGEDIYRYATQFLGNPYVFGGVDLLHGIDCSGFTMQVYRQFGIDLPHYSQSQFYYGREIPLGEEKAGDLVFYGTSPSNITHVAIADGNGGIVEAANPSSGIILSTIGSPVSIKRIIE